MDGQRPQLEIMDEVFTWAPMPNVSAWVPTAAIIINAMGAQASPLSPEKERSAMLPEVQTYIETTEKVEREYRDADHALRREFDERRRNTRNGEAWEAVQSARDAYNRVSDAAPEDEQDRLRKAYLSARQAFDASQDEARRALNEESQRIHIVYNNGMNAAWNALRASEDPTIKWIADNAHDYRHEALHILRALPATVEQLNQVAEQESWCSVWQSFRDRALRDGILTDGYDVEYRRGKDGWRKFKTGTRRLPGGHQITREGLIKAFNQGVKVVTMEVVDVDHQTVTYKFRVRRPEGSGTA